MVRPERLSLASFAFLILAAFFFAALHFGFLLRRSAVVSLGRAFLGGLESFLSKTFSTLEAFRLLFGLAFLVGDFFLDLSHTIEIFNSQ